MAPWKPCHQAEIQQQQEKIRKNGEGTKKKVSSLGYHFFLSFCAEVPGNRNFAGNYGSKDKLKRERVYSRLQHISFFYGGSK